MKSIKIAVSKFSLEKLLLRELLLKASKIEIEKLDDAAKKGGVWIQRSGRGKILRIRSLDKEVDPSDLIQIYYDERVLSLPELLSAQALFETKHYGVWIKPAGVVPQGTQAGDHSSLLRCVELMRKKEVYLIHRLDRETEGLMLIGYTPQAAGVLGGMFQKHEVSKTYEAIVLGELDVGSSQTISVQLDGKDAVTHIKSIAVSAGQTLLEIEIETGRLHQIRRHLESIGHPIMGDPKYGKGNKNKDGLKLLAFSLSMIDPWDKTKKVWQMPKHLSL